MHNNKTYRRLTDRKREEISRGLAAGTSQVEIAHTLNRHPYHHRSGISKLSPLRHGAKNLFSLFRMKRAMNRG